MTASELVERALTAAGAREDLAAFVSLDADLARAAAAAIDARRRAGEPLGPLAGVPIAIKDALCTVDQPTTAGSAILRGAKGEGYRPPYDATVVARLRAAGAIILAKTQMHELAFGISGYNPAFATGETIGVRNAYDRSRVAGGSSSGSGAAIGARIVAGGLGTDTGGSVRIP
ncbi:MAG: amidase, partial [Myxococcales bacterium]|nr:amidase [Myxococcales bacterium]